MLCAVYILAFFTKCLEPITPNINALIIKIIIEISNKEKADLALHLVPI